MALVVCHECEREVGDQAEFCPHCGIKSPGRTKRFSSWNFAKKLKICEAIAAAIAVLFVVAVIIIGSHSRSDTSQDDGNSDAAQSSSAETFVLKGRRGELAFVTMACRDLPEIEYFDSTYSQSEISPNSAEN